MILVESTSIILMKAQISWANDDIAELLQDISNKWQEDDHLYVLNLMDSSKIVDALYKLKVINLHPDRIIKGTLQGSIYRDGQLVLDNPEIQMIDQNGRYYLHHIDELLPQNRQRNTQGRPKWKNH